MLGRDYGDQTCSIARALEVVGERWTLLIVRNVALGIHRFDDMQRQLGIARNVLASRLERLVEEEILERRPYGERPVRHEYHFTAKGRGLWPVLVELMLWGDRYAPEPGGPPRVLRHAVCGGTVSSHSVCSRCGALLEFEDVISEPGPGRFSVSSSTPVRTRERPASATSPVTQG